MSDVTAHFRSLRPPSLSGVGQGAYFVGLSDRKSARKKRARKSEKRARKIEKYRSGACMGIMNVAPAQRTSHATIAWCVCVRVRA